MLTVCKRFQFCYGHHLPEYQGKCVNSHGHNATLEVEVKGPWVKNPENIYPGMVIDFGDLKRVVNNNVVEKLDHKNLNEVLPEKFQPPTAENTVMWIVTVLMYHFRSDLVRVRLYETDDSYAEWRKSWSEHGNS